MNDVQEAAKTLRRSKPRVLPFSRREFSEEELAEMLRVQKKRVELVGQEDEPTKEELAILNCFWNSHFYAMRDWVPAEAILDAETQKLTSIHPSKLARRLVSERIHALMDMGYVCGNGRIEINEHDDPQREQFWLTPKGATHFATGIPQILRRPLAFARRHLALFQLLAVGVSILVALATFAGHVLHWF